VKIAIVNHLPLAVEALRRALSSEPQHRLVWVAESGEEAIELCAKARPDVVLMGLHLPGMGGVEATRQIMLQSPCAILIATSDVERNGARVFEALGHGALDAVQVPELGNGQRSVAAPLLAKLHTISRLIGDQTGWPMPLQAPTPNLETLIAIGASAGGPAALARLLSSLPVNSSAALVIIQHVDAQFALGMAEWLAQESAWPIRLAEEGERPVVGTALLAGTSDHLVFKTSTRLGYTPDPVDYVYRPSIDVFFRTLVGKWTGSAIGVLLTGMGRDGALGLRAMRDKGHHTIAQDEASSAVYGMPKAAAALDAAVDTLAVGDIAARLQALLTDRPARLL
jgi:two-component system response regulator WspF